MASAAAGMHQFRAEAAELLRQPRDPAHLHEVAGLPDRRAASRRAAARQAAMRAMLRRHHRGDGVAFAVRSCIEHDCGCIPVHDASRLAGFGRRGDRLSSYSQWNPCAITPSMAVKPPSIAVKPPNMMPNPTQSQIAQAYGCFRLLRATAVWQQWRFNLQGAGLRISPMGPVHKRASTPMRPTMPTGSDRSRTTVSGCFRPRAGGGLL